MASILLLPFIAFFMFAFVLVWILLFVFWIMMIVDCAKRDFKNENDKVVWIIVIVFLSLIGALIYYFAVRKGEPAKEVRRNESSRASRKK